MQMGIARRDPDKQLHIEAPLPYCISIHTIKEDCGSIYIGTLSQVELGFRLAQPVFVEGEVLPHPHKSMNGVSSQFDQVKTGLLGYNINMG